MNLIVERTLLIAFVVLLLVGIGAIQRVNKPDGTGVHIGYGTSDDGANALQ